MQGRALPTHFGLALAVGSQEGARTDGTVTAAKEGVLLDQVGVTWARCPPRYTQVADVGLSATRHASL
jgi:hypothetical protein